MRWWRRHRSERLTCREVARVLQGHLDGEVDTRTARRVADHLEECVDCRFEAAVLEEIRSALRRRAPQLPEERLARLRTYAHGLLEDAGPR